VKPATSKLLRDYGLTVIAAVGVAFFIRTYVVGTYRIPGVGMSPTLLPGETIFVQKWPLHLASSRQFFRGQVIVYKHTEGSGVPSGNSIKRIMGLPGDTIHLRDGRVVLGEKLLADYLPTPSLTDEEVFPDGKTVEICLELPWIENAGPIEVPDNHLFVIGDYRSRKRAFPNQKSWEIIPQTAVQGEATRIWLSPHQQEEISCQQKSQKSELVADKKTDSTVPFLSWKRVFRRIL